MRITSASSLRWEGSGSLSAPAARRLPAPAASAGSPPSWRPSVGFGPGWRERACHIQIRSHCLWDHWRGPEGPRGAISSPFSQFERSEGKVQTERQTEPPTSGFFISLPWRGDVVLCVLVIPLSRWVTCRLHCGTNLCSSNGHAVKKKSQDRRGHARGPWTLREATCSQLRSVGFEAVSHLGVTEWKTSTLTVNQTHRDWSAPAVSCPVQCYDFKSVTYLGGLHCVSSHGACVISDKLLCCVA